MTNPLDALIELQDIDLMLREMRDPEIALHEERLGFPVENVETLERARRRLAARIDGRLLQTYERMSRRLTRVVVPVTSGICPACRMSLPTATCNSRNDDLLTIENCENCGRILYRR